MKLLPVLSLFTAVICNENNVENESPEVNIPETDKMAEKLADTMEEIPKVKPNVENPSEANRKWGKIDWENVYFEDTLDILGAKKPKESDDLKEKQIDLPGACKAWIEAQKVGGDLVISRHNQMMNIEHAIPITPHSLQQFVEGSDFCWVFFFYTSDQPDFNGPYGFAKSLATYFAERCMVGTINMSYPANQATFHNVFQSECVYEDDRAPYPCLLVRKPGGPGYEIKMLTDRIVNRSFELADILDWGFPIKSSELAGGNLDATLKEILGMVYNNQLDFQKMHSIYMPWYHKESVKFVHSEVLGRIFAEAFAEIQGSPSRKDLLEYMYDRPLLFKERLWQNKLSDRARPLPNLQARFKDEL